MKGFVIAATKSGSGKTTVTLGLLASLKRRGMRVASFKVGPDFIDPGHHSAITGRKSLNLDGWMLSRDYNMESFIRDSRNAHVAVVEGVMGLFDGYDGKSEDGSTAQMAKWLGLPVLLIVDAGSMARSAAAVVQGFENFDKDLVIAGVLFNNLGSKRHLEYLKDAMEDNTTIPCIGGLIRNESIGMPERHLGLVTAEDYCLSRDRIKALADYIDGSINMDYFLDLLPDISISGEYCSLGKTQERVRIGLARDQAFCFYYPDNLEILEGFGAELVPFSPLKDENLPADISGIYLGGGYPELWAGQLSGNRKLRSMIYEKIMEGLPVFGECGGFMYLCEGLIDQDGNVFEMVGCFPFRTRFHKDLRSLGYREITITGPCIIGDQGLKARGHEFHYSAIIEDSDENNYKRMFSVTPRKRGSEIKKTGFQVKRCLGSYIHLHFGSQPAVAENFVRTCMEYQLIRKGKP